MQVLKKVAVILCCALICGCSYMQRNSRSNGLYRYFSNSRTSEFSESTDYSQVDLGNTESFRVAMLLPLSGKYEAMGQSMKNAATMAIGDINNNNLVIQFYDTKGTDSGARVAVENAVNADSDLILGPLLSEEVAAISDKAKSKDIPVISFSTSPSVLQEGIYTLGLLGEDQLARIVKYAVSKGRSRLAVVLPDNQSGENMLRLLFKVTRNSGMNLVKVGFYPPDSMEFTDLVTSMNGNGVDFDALLIPESGNRLKAISSMFSYYDISAPDVLFMGTSVWANSNLSKETELYGAVYPSMSLTNQNHFVQKYNDLFGEKPQSLSIYAYDAVALASALARKNKRYIEEEIIRPDGYVGMSGLFRVFEEGRNEHGLDVLTVTSSGEKVVDAAPQQFYDLGYANKQVSLSSGYYDMPIVYGKDAAAVQNILLNVR